MHTMSEMIRHSKDAHLRSTGKIPLHAYIPRWVRDRLTAEIKSLANLTGATLADDVIITHIHGLQLHTLPALDLTDVVCALYEEPI